MIHYLIFPEGQYEQLRQSFRISSERLILHDDPGVTIYHTNNKIVEHDHIYQYLTVDRLLTGIEITDQDVVSTFNLSPNELKLVLSRMRG